MTQPSWRDWERSQEELAAVLVLHEYQVLDHDIINAFPRWESRWIFPRSHYLREATRPVVLPLVDQDEADYKRLMDRYEYRAALAQQKLRNEHTFRPAPGEYMGGRWDDRLAELEADFLRTVPLDAWGFEDLAAVTALRGVAFTLVGPSSRCGRQQSRSCRRRGP